MNIRNEEGAEIVITPEDFKGFWKRVSEWTTSSPSSIHYGHYKASVKHEASAKIHAQQLTVIARSGVCPERWSVSLQVLLEKIAGICLVEKLRYIQLYESDFIFFSSSFLAKRPWTLSQKMGSCLMNTSARKEALLRTPSLTRLSWQTCQDKPENQ